MRTLDLFAGLKGWSAPALARGHSVVTLDFDPKFHADHVLDILEVQSLTELERDDEPFDLIFASPPCEGFSVAAMGKNWERYMGVNPRNGRREWLIRGPKHLRADLAMKIAEHTFDLIDTYVATLALVGHPVAYVIENPIGALRVMPFVLERDDRVSTWYCRWDDRRPGLDKPRAKPTDLWTNIAGPWPMCGPGRDDHESAPRGARTGTQGHKTPEDRAVIPEKLALAVIERVERGEFAASKLLRAFTEASVTQEKIAW